MLEIKDFDEKKHIIAYYKCFGNKSCVNTFTNSQIYSSWIDWWKDDFILNGKCIQMYKQKLVLSGAKWRAGIRPKEYEERTALLTSIVDWINENYSKRISKKMNRNNFHGMLMKLRERHIEDLISKLSNQYHIEEITNKNELELKHYKLFYNGELIGTGSYDEVKDFIVNMKK